MTDKFDYGIDVEKVEIDTNSHYFNEQKEFRASAVENRMKNSGERNGEKIHYKLGQEINNGIKYFGQEKADKHRQLTAVCICTCGKSWRALLHQIRNGHLKSCGCKDKRRKK